VRNCSAVWQSSADSCSRCWRVIKKPRFLMRGDTALEHDNEDVKEQAHLAATAQFFYALGLLYTRGIIIPPEVPGASSRAEEPSPVTACEVFGEALERFAREQGLGRGIGRELGELSEKARICFRALAPESEQLERVRDENIRLGRKKAVNA
jgi:hypothetical protein